MALRIAARSRFWEALYDELAARIMGGLWPTGTRLPAELELAREHGVSRNVVRSALKRLREEGFIVSKQGGGSIVTYNADARAPITKIESITDLVLCFELRAAIEAEAAALASVRATADDLTNIEDSLENMRRALENGRPVSDVDAYIEADYQFHLRIATSAHNPFFVDVMRLLEEQAKFAMNLSKDLLNHGQERTDLLVYREHWAIFEAIRSRDAQQARAMTERHLAFARHRILGDGVLLRVDK